MSNPPELLAALMLGLLGSTHCIGMCGGISAALAFALGRDVGPARRPGDRIDDPVGEQRDEPAEHGDPVVGRGEGASDAGGGAGRDEFERASRQPQFVVIAQQPGAHARDMGAFGAACGTGLGARPRQPEGDQGPGRASAGQQRRTTPRRRGRDDGGGLVDDPARVGGDPDRQPDRALRPSGGQGKHAQRQLVEADLSQFDGLEVGRHRASRQRAPIGGPVQGQVEQVDRPGLRPQQRRGRRDERRTRTDPLDEGEGPQGA